MNTRNEVESILGRKLTGKEVQEYRFFWTRVFMNPYDLAEKIKKGG